MKIVHVTKTRIGGAGIAAQRTVAALRSAGADAELWTEGRPGLGPGSGSAGRWILDKLDSVPTRLRYRRRRYSSWSNNWRQTRITQAINAAKPDVVHLHWIAQGFMSLDELAAIDAPLVWTLHDPWPITGGCHYPGDCERFTVGCGECPQLRSRDPNDLSADNWRKKQTISRVRRWVAPSAWIASLAVRNPSVQASAIRVIPNPIDLDQWPALSSVEARQKLKLPSDALVLAAGAMDLREPRKGAALLAPTVAAIAAAQQRRTVLLLFGAGRVPTPSSANVDVRCVGRVAKASDLAVVYSAADALLMPSLQDNQSNVVMEAQAAGCPVVGFDAGGTREIVVTGETGWLTAEKTSASLAVALQRWREVGRSRAETAARSRERLGQLFSPASHATALQREYEALLAECAANSAAR